VLQGEQVHGSSRGGEREVVFLESRREELQRGVGQRGHQPRVHQHAGLHGGHDVFGRVQFERARVEARRRGGREHAVHRVRGRRDAQEHGDRELIGRVAQRQKQVTQNARVEALGVLHDDRHRRGGREKRRAATIARPLASRQNNRRASVTV
jgi:hypothetical protein